MTTQGRLMILILAGGYLIYQGGTLIKNVCTERTDNYLVFMLFGIVFLILGVLFVGVNMKKLVKHEYMDPFEELESDDEDEETGESKEENEPERIEKNEEEKEEGTCE